MSLRIKFLERREVASPSIERVFNAVSSELEKSGVKTTFVKAPFGNSFLSTLLNLISFRPSDADVLHIAGHLNYLALVLPTNKTVLTFHDLTILDFRTGVRRWLIERLYFVWPARRLKYLTAISEATKNSLVELARIPPEKVKVIENPLLVKPKGVRNFNDLKPTILQIGTAINKNVDRLIAALDGLSCTFRIIGPLSDPTKLLLSNAQIDFVNDTFLTDEDIEDAYQDADIVTLCSTHEGFGLPIIEAQACGVAVVTSGKSPMREVAGGAALLADPHDVGSIRNAIVRLIDDPQLRSELIEKGRKNVRRFNVDRIASEYLAIYHEIVMKNGR